MPSEIHGHQLESWGRLSSDMVVEERNATRSELVLVLRLHNKLAGQLGEQNDGTIQGQTQD